MSRVKLTEFRAKKILIGNDYSGIRICDEKAILPSKGRYAIKVDQGIKRRFKKGLVLLDQDAQDLPKALTGLREQNYSCFLIEPYIPHEPEDEQYLSFERVREGIRVMYAREGGIDIESRPDGVSVFLYSGSPESLSEISRKTGLSPSFLNHLFDKFELNYFSFMEINPLVITKTNSYLMDAAVLVDSAAEFFVNDWTSLDFVSSQGTCLQENNVARLQKTSPATFKLIVLNPDGSLFFLLSGGGGSIVVEDEVALMGLGNFIGNYGEYSGGPTREETYLYTKEIISLMLNSKAPKKALVIAGGVANFTDIRQTFLGIMDAMQEFSEEMRNQGIKVFVRRGGPHEKEGLDSIDKFLKDQNLFGAVYGSEAVITSAVTDAVKYVKP